MEADQLWRLLGDLPQHPSLSAVKISEELHPDGYYLEKWSLDLNGEEMVPAYVARPISVNGRVPLVLVNHSHGGMYDMGKTELIEPSHYLQSPSYAKTLTDMGYIAACIDMWGFGERSGRKESEMVKEMLWKGQVVWGMMLYDNMRFLDILLQREDIDSNRVGTMGMSMGAMQAWWLAALDQRIKLVVDMGGQVDAHTLMANRYLDKHGFYSYVPGLLKYFETADIQERIIPRKRLTLNGAYDLNCPLAGVKKLAVKLTEAYSSAGVPNHFKSLLFGCGHKETAEMRWHWQQFFQSEWGADQ